MQSDGEPRYCVREQSLVGVHDPDPTHPEEEGGLLDNRGRSAGAPGHLASTLLFHLSGLLVVLALPGQVWFGRPVWTLDAGAVPQSLAMGLAYLLAALARPTPTRSFAQRAAITLVAIGGAFSLAYGLQPLRTDLPFSRGIFLIAVSAAAVLLVGRELASVERRAITGIASHLAASALLVVGFLTAPRDQASDAGFIRTAYHPLRVTVHDSVIAPDDVHPGGAIKLVGTQVLAVTGAGVLYALARGPDLEVVARRLPVPPPLDLLAYDSVMPPGISRGGVRAMDFVTRATDDGWELFASHHHWVSERACLVLRVSRVFLDGMFTPLDPTDPWQAVFESDPCLPAVEEHLRPPLSAIASGGRLAWKGADLLALTVGDMERPELAQMDTADYGKTLLIDLGSGTSERFSRGHRVPQGLWVDSDGSMWSTEHGPMGGDELNLLGYGGDYGWPATTYGTDYGHYVWRPPLESSPPGVAVAPVYSWLPSIGVSSLIRVGGRTFDRWAGDLLVASLKQMTLFRLHVVDARVVYAEPIPIGIRIRDLVEDADGALWLWGEDVVVTIDAGAEHHRGAELFASCAQCHLVEDFSGMLGPTLWGVVGRRVAGRGDFDYSDALRALGGRWTEERLDAFLEAPSVFAPGNTMYFPGLSDPADRAALITHLMELAR